MKTRVIIECDHSFSRNEFRNELRARFENGKLSGGVPGVIEFIATEDAADDAVIKHRGTNLTTRG